MRLASLWKLACLMICAILMQGEVDGSKERGEEGEEERRLGRAERRAARRRQRKVRHRGARARLRRYLSSQDEASPAWGSYYLYADTGYFLAINDEGEVTTTLTREPEAKIQIQTIDSGLVVLRGVTSNAYLAINQSGKLISTPSVTEECLFYESYLTETHRTVFKSVRYRRKHWHIGVRRNSRPFRNKHRQGAKLRQSFFFLPLRAV